MLIYTVDIGTTNLKVSLYDHGLRRLAAEVVALHYFESGVVVEFNPATWFDQIVDCLRACGCAAGIDTSRLDAMIVLTGQADSFVLTDRDGHVLRPGISWLDSRSAAEANEIAATFPAADAFRITGQPFATPTWPATKLRWLRHHEPSTLSRTARVMMLKDYVQWRFTGEIVGELSTRAFSYLFDINTADYWPEMLRFCGLQRDQMPSLVRPCTNIGAVLPALRSRLPMSRNMTVNVGTLDHFASMIGTGSYRTGVASESAGTVLSLSVLLEHDRPEEPVASYHRGAKGDDYVLFDICDSGGICLDWYRKISHRADPGEDFDKLLAGYEFTAAPIFLPYLTGLNPPDYNQAARAAFLDLHIAHEPADMVYAVMEGVAHLLRQNVDYCKSVVPGLDGLISTGGGTRSSFWTQLKADVSHCPISVPDETEATSRGAAVIGLVSAGLLSSFAEAAAALPMPARTFFPEAIEAREARYARFLESVAKLYG